MKSFPALTVLVWAFRVLAVLSTLGICLLAIGTGHIEGFIGGIVMAFVNGLVLWGMGEIIRLTVDAHQQLCVSAEAQIRTYQLLKDRPTIKRLKNTRKAS